MRTSKMIRGLLFGMGCLLLAQEAMAGASCVTRANCGALTKRYVAKSHVLCGVVPVCLKQSSGCGSAYTNCEWKNCLYGGGMSRAINGPGGCQIYTYRVGMGIAGEAFDPMVELDENDASGTEALSSAEFDAATGTVTIHLSDGRLTATPGGLAQRLTVTLFQEDGTEEDPTPTAANTLWSGSVVVNGGKFAVTGFDASDFTLSTNDEGLSEATFSDIEVVLPLDISAADFANVVVKVLTDEIVPVG